MTKIYIIEFATGEYEDKRDTIHKAYFDKNIAEIECNKLNKQLIDNRIHKTNIDIDHYYKKELNLPYYIDYTGGEYYMYSIDVE